jgi:hypothetical protein
VPQTEYLSTSRTKNDWICHTHCVLSKPKFKPKSKSISPVSGERKSSPHDIILENGPTSEELKLRRIQTKPRKKCDQGGVDFTEVQFKRKAEEMDDGELLGGEAFLQSRERFHGEHTGNDYREKYCGIEGSRGIFGLLCSSQF